jgi:hypothetical protein
MFSNILQIAWNFFFSFSFVAAPKILVKKPKVIVFLDLYYFEKEDNWFYNYIANILMVLFVFFSGINYLEISFIKGEKLFSQQARILLL